MNAVRFVIAVCVCIAGICDAKVALVDEGQGMACIVIGGRATAVERFAAQELQRYIQEITQVVAQKGVMLPVFVDGARYPAHPCEILLGRPDSNAAVATLCAELHIALDEKSLGADGYVVRSYADAKGKITLLLTGSHDRGVLFAVYHLLEACGVRFFGYRERDGEIVPRRASLHVPDFNVVERPAMRYRFVSDNNYSAADKTRLTNIVDWAAKNRCNTFMLTPSRAGESWDQIALEEVRKRGLMIAGPGHVLAQFTPAQALFATHPEYFPLIQGKRSPVYSAAWGGVTSFCWSNEDAMKFVVTRAMRYLNAAPFIDLFAVYPPDGSQRGAQCQCENCAKLTMSDWYLTLINHIARECATAFPRKKVMWIAYNECGVPPTQVRPWDEGKNLVLLWCNDLRDFRAPMDSEANRHAASYLALKPRLKTIKTNGLKHPTDLDLAAWHRWQRWSAFLKAGGYAGEVVMLDYYNQHVGNSLQVPLLQFCQSGPWPDGIMQQDFQCYAAQGIAGWQNCTDYYNDTPTPYWNRLSAQLMWNPQADVAAIDHDFHQQLYDSAGETMQRYFTALWHAMATLGTSNPFDKIEFELAAAEKIAREAGNAAVMARIKAAHEFHQRCVKTAAALKPPPQSN